MSISFGPFVAGFLIILILTIYVYVVLNHMRNGILGSMKWIFICMSVLLVRMLVPVNFPFTITLYDKWILPRIGDIIFQRINGVMYFDIGVTIWIVVAVLLIGRLAYKTISLQKDMRVFIDDSFELKSRLSECADEKRIKRIRVAIVPNDISPAITGFIHPTLILPEYVLSMGHINNIIEHEIKHFLNYDLYLKLLIELLTCVYWWNPVVYLLKRQFFLSIEISNDVSVIYNKTDKEKIEYAESILTVMKRTKKESQRKMEYALSYTDPKENHAYVRIKKILYGKPENGKRKLFLNGILMITILVIGFVFVPESVGREPAEEGVFNPTPENSYFLKTESGYALYVNEKYMGTIDEIPDEFSGIKIKEESN